MEDLDPALAVRYLEFLIAERREESQPFHDRMVELYIRTTLDARERDDESARTESYGKLLKFLDTTDNYNVGRIYGILSSHGQSIFSFTRVTYRADIFVDLYEARAILLGRLGRHDQALDILVHRLHDHLGAEEYLFSLSSFRRALGLFFVGTVSATTHPAPTQATYSSLFYESTYNHPPKHPPSS